MIKKFISVASHALDPLPLSQTVTPSRTPPPLERDVLYGRSLEYNATDGGFQGESQKLGRHIANSHLIGRDRAYGPQRCRVY